MKLQYNKDETNPVVVHHISIPDVELGETRDPRELRELRDPREPKRQRTLTLSLACWNIRTLLDLESSSSPERRTALVAKELARYNLDIIALSETRFSGEGQLTEKGGGYTFFWKGKPEGERRDSGVGFAIRSKLVDRLEEFPHGISDRLMLLRLALSKDRFASIISVYAPTQSSSEDVIDQFYADLGLLISKVHNDDKLIVSMVSVNSL